MAEFLILAALLCMIGFAVPAQFLPVAVMLFLLGYVCCYVFVLAGRARNSRRAARARSRVAGFHVRKPRGPQAVRKAVRHV